MADAATIKKDIGPLIETLNRYHEFNPENEAMDSDESGYAVFLQREDEEPIALSKPSLALFHGDPVLYFQESEKIKLARYHDILNLTSHPRNKQNFDDLLKVHRANKITPFVGAGASISAGCQSWRDYLENKAKEVGLEEATIDDHLKNGRMEDLLEIILQQPNGAAFDFYFQQDFEHASPEASYIWSFPEIFNGCVITTNFDRVIEDCYDRQGRSFKEKTVGLNNPHNFIKAITRGERYLLKLHGNIDYPEHRVFTKAEYQRAYSQDDMQLVDMEYPLPRMLSHLYRSHSFLFVGCSLAIDRTVKTFEVLLESEDRNKLADHFAVIERPEDDQEFKTLSQRLMHCNIKPIWFDYGEYEKVGEIINLMKV